MFKILVILLFLVVTPVYGYIDPGSGSFIFQLIIAGLAGGLYAIKVFWKQITQFFGKTK